MKITRSVTTGQNISFEPHSWRPAITVLVYFFSFLLNKSLVSSRNLDFNIFCNFDDLFNYSYVYISSNIFPISLKNFIIFSTSKSFPVVFKLLWIFTFFLLSLHCGHSSSQCFITSVCFLHSVFVHASCWSFLDIKYSWVRLTSPSNMEPLNLASYCLQLSLALFYSLM